MKGHPAEFQVPSDDPASILWSRVEPEDRATIEPFLAEKPVKIGALAQSLGLDVLATALPISISGQIRRRPSDGTFEIKVNFADVPVRQRFTVAHEIGHFLLHRSDIDGDGITDTILYRSRLSDRKEAEANRMAAFLLLPWNAVQSWCETTLGHPVNEDVIQKVANAWVVSDLTVGFRFGF